MLKIQCPVFNETNACTDTHLLIEVAYKSAFEAFCTSELTGWMQHFCIYTWPSQDVCWRCSTLIQSNAEHGLFSNASQPCSEVWQTSDVFGALVMSNCWFCISVCSGSVSDKWHIWSGDDVRLLSHTLSTAFRHLPPNSARYSYTTEGILFISLQQSTDVVSALWKVQVLIWLEKQPSAQACV